MNPVLKMKGKTMIIIGNIQVIGQKAATNRRKVERKYFLRLKTLTVVFVTRHSQVGLSTRSTKVRTMSKME